MMHIINYGIRIAIIIIGILFLCGVVTLPNGDDTLYNMLGGIFILFGLYRIVLYRMKTKQYQSIFNDDSEENNDDSKENKEIE
jgi:hypothetical protein